MWFRLKNVSEFAQEFNLTKNLAQDLANSLQFQSKILPISVKIFDTQDFTRKLQESYKLLYQFTRVNLTIII